MIDLEILVNGHDPGGALEDLLQWLMDEPDLRGAVRVNSPSMTDRELGAVIDILIVALSSGGTASVLAASLKAWFSQPKRDNVSISIRWPDGTAVDVNARNVKDVATLLSMSLPPR